MSLSLFQEESPIIVDRSTLERYCVCPHQAFLIDSGAVSSGNELTDVGSEVHSVLSRAVKARHADGISAFDMRQLIEELAAISRPDVQPQTIAALRRAYPIVSLICANPAGSGERAPEDLLRFDGGEGDHSGQLACDFLPATEDRGTIRLTGEVDLLMATASAKELELIDWKAGWKTWTAGDVAGSFQFQFYSVLVFRNYPGVDRVTVRVFNVREGYATSPVEFDRAGQYAAEKRIQTALTHYLAHSPAVNPQATTAPAWPAPAKCANCSAAPRCSAAHSPEADLAKDPEAYLRAYVATCEAAERMKTNLTTYRRQRGADLVFGDMAFGSEKPTTPRAKPCDYYTAK